MIKHLFAILAALTIAVAADAVTIEYGGDAPFDTMRVTLFDAGEATPLVSVITSSVFEIEGTGYTLTGTPNDLTTDGEDPTFDVLSNGGVFLMFAAQDVLVTPVNTVPAPAAGVLMGVGLVGLFYAGSRKAR